jgi:hypothetical protein
MKKDELVHLHSLLTVLRAEYERRGVVSESAFERYEGLGVSQAVQALASALAAASPDEASPVTDGRDEAANRSERNVAVQS